MSHNVSIERIRAALSYLDACNRDVWVRAAMCIKDELGEAGFDVWDNWGADYAQYKASHAKAVWKSVKANSKLKINTLIFDARRAGWKDDSNRKKWTAEEIKAYKERAEARAKAAAEEERVLREAAALRARQIWSEASPVVDDDHYYLKKKGVKAYGLRIGKWEHVDAETGEVRLVTKNGLLVPMTDRSRTIHSLQCILPTDSNRNKWYLADGAKQGHFHVVGGKPQTHEDKSVFILVEGYATGASVHEATGHTVLVCFDKSNLMVVARSLRERQAAAIILFAADNDTHEADNPGVTCAKAAAEFVGGLVAIPPPGDFNDLHAASGLDAVAELINGTIDGTLTPEEPADDDTLFGGDEFDAVVGEATQAVAVATPAASDDDDLDEVNSSGHFTILGYDRGEFFVFIHAQKQISSFKPGELSEANLLMMAPLDWWEFHFPGKNGMSRKLVLNWFFRLAHARGLYNVKRLRGRGAWEDDGRFVYHQGGELYVDGVATDVTDIKSKYIYEMASSDNGPASAAMPASEGNHLLNIAHMFQWSKPGAAALLAGWTFLAPLCGAIKWRPHIWITGGAGSGKSTILNDYVSTLLGTKLFAQGNSTEAGLRQTLKADAIPVLFDESEQNDESEKRRMGAVIALIRQASTESVAQTYKGSTGGTAMSFHIRSMFCLASIQAPLDQKADEDRLTKLSLVSSDKAEDAEARWIKVKDELYKLGRDKTLPDRMLRRAIDMIPTIQQNISVFVAAAAKKFGTQRLGDQYGTMLAGAWSLTRDHVATEQDAYDMIAYYDWSEFIESGDVEDPRKVVNAILEAKLVSKGESFSVGTLISIANGELVEGISNMDKPNALRLLRENGMNFHGADWFVFQNGSINLRKLIADCPFSADLKAHLTRIKGSKKFDAKRFANGTISRCVGIPLSWVVGDAKELESPPDDAPL